MHRIALLGALAALFLTVGCKKRPRGPKKPQCRFDAAALSELRAATDLDAISAEKRKKWTRLTLDKCTGWPRALTSFLALKAATASEETAAAFKGTTDRDQKVWDRLMEETCPGILKMIDKLFKNLPEGKAPHVWKVCKFEQHKVITQREFGEHWNMALPVFMYYRMLRRSGLKHQEARNLTRIIMSSDRYAQKEGEFLLVQSPSRTNEATTSDVMISLSTLLVNNVAVANLKAGRVDANTKRDGPDGYFIEPVYKALKKDRAKWIGLAKKDGVPFSDQLILAVHKNTPFRLVAEVIYTASELGYRRFQLAVESSEVRYGVYLLDLVFAKKAPKPGPGGMSAPSMRPGPMTPRSQPKKTKRPKRAVPAPTPPPIRPVPGLAGKHLKLWLTWKAYSLVSADGKTVAFPRKQGKGVTARVPLIKELYDRFQKGKTSLGTDGVIHLVVGDTIHYGDFIHLLRALQQKPGAAGGKGCRLVFDKKKAQWSIDPAAKKHCWLPFPKLVMTKK